MATTYAGIDVDELQRLADANREAWVAFRQQVSAAVKSVGGTISAEITLPAELRERVRVGYNYITRVYSKALVKISIGADLRSRDDYLIFSVQLGVVGKNGTFFPEPQDGTLVRLQGIEHFVVWFGGGQKFVDAVFTASTKSASINAIDVGVQG
jgi:hypothetical protein